MSKPPITPPDSDIDGVHEDEASNVDAANAADQTSADLERAHRGNAARPKYSDKKSADDRSH